MTTIASRFAAEELEFRCPCCGYLAFDKDPLVHNGSHDICPCCAVEIGLPAGWTWEELRDEWIEGGMKWWFEDQDKPEGWDPSEQVKHATGFGKIT